MILFEGSYSDVLRADEHYILLEKDFSNLNQVVNKLRDNDYLMHLVQHCHASLIQSGLYSQQQLGRLVACTIKKHLAQLKHQASATMNVDLIKNNHKAINALLCLSAEIRFMIANFFTLLCDPSYRGFKKFNLIFSGFARYLSYIKSRFKRHMDMPNA
jgi:hypothetical protein